MKRTRRGDQREVDVAKALGEGGWLVGSRRHIGGAGDLLAVTFHLMLLCEVKTTINGPWEHFRPSDRAALVAKADEFGAIPCLAWWPPRGRLNWFRPASTVESSATWPEWDGPLASFSSRSTSDEAGLSLPSDAVAATTP